jgi:alpha-tubulin suppressor-like RCC1 family protein
MSIKKLFAAVTALVIAGALSISPANAVSSPQMSIGAMQNTTCVIQVGGGMWCWGDNQYGQVGNGTTTTPDSPVQEATSSTEWRYLFDSTGNHMCAIKTNGTLWCWGNNEDGQLGLGDTINRNVPTQVGTDTTWRSGAAGIASTCAIKLVAGHNTLWCWGANGEGQMGNGTSGSDVLSPVQADLTDWLSVSVGTKHVCAVRTTGSLWCWGGNSNGQLGIGSTDAKLHPTQVAGSWKSVDTSDDGPGAYSCGIKADQTLWCWGRGADGDDVNTLGLGTTTQTSVPLQVGTSTWSSVGAGAWTACGIQAADASLWCWGDGYQGNLGTGIPNDQADSGTPTTPVTGGAAWAAVARGRDHACAVRTDATVWCWGSNWANQAGLGAGGGVLSTPVQMDLTADGFNLPETNRDGRNFNGVLLLLAGALAAAGVGLSVRKDVYAK